MTYCTVLPPEGDRGRIRRRWDFFSRLLLPHVHKTSRNSQMLPASLSLIILSFLTFQMRYAVSDIRVLYRRFISRLGLLPRVKFPSAHPNMLDYTYLSVSTRGTRCLDFLTPCSPAPRAFLLVQRRSPSGRDSYSPVLHAAGRSVSVRIPRRGSSSPNFVGVLGALP